VGLGEPLRPVAGLLDLGREQRRLALELPATGLSSNSLSDPERAGSTRSIRVWSLLTTQQWHLGWITTTRRHRSRSSYGGSRGLTLRFLHGNQATPDPNASDPLAPRRPAPIKTGPANRRPLQSDPARVQPRSILQSALDNIIDTSARNSVELQLPAGSLEKPLLSRTQYELAYTSPTPSTTRPAPAWGGNNGDFLDQAATPPELWHADFDVRHRFRFQLCL